jgi:hypothetical protein
MIQVEHAQGEQEITCLAKYAGLDRKPGLGVVGRLKGYLGDHHTEHDSQSNNPQQYYQDLRRGENSPKQAQWLRPRV